MDKKMYKQLMFPEWVYYRKWKIKIEYIGKKKANKLNCLAMYLPDKNKILILKHQSYENIINSLLHECLHAICNLDNLEVAKYGEEKIVSNFSDAIIRLIKQNPLLPRLLKKIKK